MPVGKVKKASNGSSRWVDLNSLCAYLPLSKKSIRNLSRRLVNPLPSYRINGKTLWDLAEVDRWVRSHKPAFVDVDEVADGILRCADNE